VAALVLINPLVRPPDPAIIQGLADLLAAGVETFDSIESDIKKDGSIEASYEATPLKPAESLFAALGPLEAGLSTVTAPTLVLQSREDHVVTSDNGDTVVATVSGPIERIWLENSYHVATLDNDAALVEGAAVTFLKEAFAP
jgi:carboxylesterase